MHPKEVTYYREILARYHRTKCKKDKNLARSMISRWVTDESAMEADGTQGNKNKRDNKFF